MASFVDPVDVSVISEAVIHVKEFEITRDNGKLDCPQPLIVNDLYKAVDEHNDVNCMRGTTLKSFQKLIIFLTTLPKPFLESI